jgi:hypothetical protein
MEVRAEPNFKVEAYPPVVDETLKNTGVQTVQKTFKSQISDDKGAPIIQTPATKVITVSPPSDSVTLGQQAKGDTSNSLTWLAAFWLRILKKALHFGWKIIGKEVPNVS